MPIKSHESETWKRHGILWVMAVVVILGIMALYAMRLYNEPPAAAHPASSIHSTESTTGDRPVTN